MIAGLNAGDLQEVPLPSITVLEGWRLKKKRLEGWLTMIFEAVRDGQQHGGFISESADVNVGGKFGGRRGLSNAGYTAMADGLREFQQEPRPARQRYSDEVDNALRDHLDLRLGLRSDGDQVGYTAGLCTHQEREPTLRDLRRNYDARMPLQARILSSGGEENISTMLPTHNASYVQSASPPRPSRNVFEQHRQQASPLSELMFASNDKARSAAVAARQEELELIQPRRPTRLVAQGERQLEVRDTGPYMHAGNIEHELHVDHLHVHSQHQAMVGAMREEAGEWRRRALAAEAEAEAQCKLAVAATRKMSGLQEQLDTTMLLCAELSMEKDEYKALVRDAMGSVSRLRRRNDGLEEMIAYLLESSEEAARRAYDEKCRLMEANQKSRDDKGGALGLANTRAAIEKAVAEAAKLPESQRSKKLNALRLKWHPDKHEHLREMATEVTQIINETVQRLIDCGGSDMEGNSDGGNESGGGRSGGSSGSTPRRPGASCNVDID